MISEDKVKILKELGFGGESFIEELNGKVHQLYSGFTVDGCHSIETAIINYLIETRDKGFYVTNPLMNYLINECGLLKEVLTYIRQIKKYLKFETKLITIGDCCWLFIKDDLNDTKIARECIVEIKKAIVLLDFDMQRLNLKYKNSKKIKKN